MGALMQALRIDWKLQRPMVCRTHEIHLDSLLAWARVQEAGGDWTARHDLPLEVERHGEDWCFKASIVVFNNLEPVRLMHMVRRTDPTQIALDGNGGGLLLKMATIDTGSRHLKGYSWHQATQMCDTATAWCVGDLDRVTELLGRVQSLGKLSRNSFGLIREFSVAPAEPQEAERWMIRALPAGFEGGSVVQNARAAGVEFALMQGRHQPPYWSPEKARVLEPIRW